MAREKQEKSKSGLILLKSSFLLPDKHWEKKNSVVVVRSSHKWRAFFPNFIFIEPKYPGVDVILLAQDIFDDNNRCLGLS